MRKGGTKEEAREGGKKGREKERENNPVREPPQYPRQSQESNKLTKIKFPTLATPGTSKGVAMAASGLCCLP